MQSARQEPLGALPGPGKDQRSPAQHHTEAAFVPAAISTFLQSPGRERRERHLLSQPPALCSHPDTQAGGGDDGQHPESRLGVVPLPGNARRTGQQGMGENHSRAGERGMAWGSIGTLCWDGASSWWESGAPLSYLGPPAVKPSPQPLQSCSVHQETHRIIE